MRKGICILNRGGFLRFTVGGGVRAGGWARAGFLVRARAEGSERLAAGVARRLAGWLAGIAH